MTDLHDRMIGQLLLGRYRIVQLLAQGGMGAVYLARVEGAEGFAKPVVVKRILPHLSDSVGDQERFIREAKILSNIHHPSIVDVIDFGKAGGAYLMVLEYVHGYHLGQWMKYVVRTRERMPWHACVHVIIQILGALQYAHEHRRSDGTKTSIIHGDISPSNILLDIEGNVRLADFGIARIEAETTSRNGTIDGIFRGKLSYAAPELLACENPTASTDVYACGVVLYHLLSGSNPFNASEPKDIIGRVLNVVPEPISAKRKDLPLGLDEVVSEALAKKPSQRYATAKDFAIALRKHLDQMQRDVAAETAAMLRADFTGNLATVLGIQPLEELETAWRQFSERPGIAGRMSMPPTVNLRLQATPARVLEETSTTATAPPASIPRPNLVVAAEHSSRRLMATVIAAGLVAAAVAVAVVLGLRGAPQSTEPRYLVVESREDQAQTHHVTADVAPSARNSAPADSDVAERGISGPKPLRIEPDRRNPLDTLSRVFSRRQSAIEHCFHSNASNISGTPEVSIRFGIDMNGKVTSATVRPNSVAATALGACLEQVALATTFGSQEKPLSFSIPITARAR